MSINISGNKPMNDEAKSMLKELLGEPFAQDNKIKLFNDIGNYNQKDMQKLANVAMQPITVELQDLGDIKELADETKYIVTAKGWEKITKIE